MAENNQQDENVLSVSTEPAETGVNQLLSGARDLPQEFLNWLGSNAFYTEAGLLLTGLVLGFGLGHLMAKQFSRYSQQSEMFSSLNGALASFATPLSVVVVLAITSRINTQSIEQHHAISLAMSFALVWLLIRVIRTLIPQGTLRKLLLWIITPLAILSAFNLLAPFLAILDGFSLQVGNITVSLLGIGRGLLFGGLLFWLGRRSNTFGQNAIRSNQTLDTSTKELLSKLFEIVLYLVLFIVLLQIVGINLTALTVFGGALGVGLGFGLQQIASNFVSGLIILFDRSITVGDHIELEDGTFGVLKEIKLRYAVIETYEGKEAMVPNETFVTNAFTNWSHTDDKQRYDFKFAVAYDTDLHALFELVRKVVASHPQVISGEDAPKEEQPDAEIDEFGDSGIVVLVEFWMHGIDDGRNRVDADLKLMVWDALRENGFKMPFPQREVRLLNQEK